MDSNKALHVLLTAPTQPVRVTIGDTFPVSAEITASNVNQCEVKLSFDASIFEETSGLPNPRKLVEPNERQEVGWWLQVHNKPSKTAFVTIEANANGLVQQAEFRVEVIA